MKAHVVIPKIGGSITADDHKFFSNIHIFIDEYNRNVVTFDYDNPVYYENWCRRVDAFPVGDKKAKLRLDIERTVGDIRDRISDNFKLSQILLIMMLEFYKFLQDTSDMDSRIRDVFEFLKSKYNSENPIFNIQLKESFLSEIEKVINREKTVVDFINYYSEYEQ